MNLRVFYLTRRGISDGYTSATERKKNPREGNFLARIFLFI